MTAMSALTFSSAEVTVPTIDQIKLGEDYSELTAAITWLTHHTDLSNDGQIVGYIAEFTKVYPAKSVAIKSSELPRNLMKSCALSVDFLRDVKCASPAKMKKETEGR